MPSLLKISGNENKVIGGNGKLTAELFEAAGVAITETPPAAVVEKPVTVASEFGANARSKSFFEATIAAEWRKNVTAIIKTGQLLIEAKEELHRDVFGALKLPFEPRVSQMLRRIAGHPILSNLANHGSLPPCWRTLYELTKIEDDVLKAAIADGRINSKLRRKEIRGKIQGLPPNNKKKDSEPSAPKLADIWLNSSPKEKRDVLDREGRTGLAEIVPVSVLVELGDHALALQINAASCPNMRSNKSTDVRVILTKILRQAVGATTPTASSNAWAALRRKCEANNLGFQDLLITFPKKRAPKKR